MKLTTKNKYFAGNASELRNKDINLLRKLSIKHLDLSNIGNSSFSHSLLLFFESYISVILSKHLKSFGNLASVDVKILRN